MIIYQSRHGISAIAGIEIFRDFRDCLFLLFVIEKYIF